MFYVTVIPYPGLESFSSFGLFLLSFAVVIRIICWQHLLYFPYPIHEKSKVTSFSDNLGEGQMSAPLTRGVVC